MTTQLERDVPTESQAIPRALAALTSAADHLEKVQLQLLERLRPVMTPEVEEGSDLQLKGSEATPCSAVADSIFRQVDRIHIIARNLSAAIERMEL